MSMTSMTASVTLSDEHEFVRSSGKVIRVRTGNVELAMKTDCLSGVFQLSNQHRLTEKNTVLTAKGEFPVVSLGAAVSENLGVSLKPSSMERALIAIEHQSDVFMLRADSVSRPAAVPAEHLHPMPKIANVHDDRNFTPFIANVSPDESDPRKAIRWVFDPFVAIGRKANSPSSGSDGETAYNPLPKDAATAVTSTSKENSFGVARGAGQLLAFVPDDVQVKNADFVFCLPLNAIAEVINTRRDIDSTVNTPFFDGFILWRQVPVPIVRLGKIFGESDSDKGTDTSRRLVIARTTGNRFVGFYAKSQMQTMQVPTATPKTKPRLAACPHLGSFRTELGDVVVPDIDRILRNDF